MVTLYVPTPTFDKSSVVIPLLHKYVNGVTPEDVVRFTAPSLTPEQLTLVASAAAATAQQPSSTIPEQLSSAELPHTSEAAGLMAALVSLQSVLFVT